VRRTDWLAGVLILAGGLLLTSCATRGASARDLASFQSGSPAAVDFVSLKHADLPPGFSVRPLTASDEALDEQQTLAEYSCERIPLPTTKATVTDSTPDYVNSERTTEVHETTASFPTPTAASARLDLELSSLYPRCKATAFHRALVESSPPGEQVGAVAVRVSPVSPRTPDRGVDVVGVCTLELSGGVSATATADLVVLVRGRIVVELSIDTDGPDPTSLINQLTAELAKRLDEVVSE
jgi:hypothetical protein